MVAEGHFHVTDDVAVLVLLAHYDRHTGRVDELVRHFDLEVDFLEAVRTVPLESTRLRVEAIALFVLQHRYRLIVPECSKRVT